MSTYLKLSSTGKYEMRLWTTAIYKFFTVTFVLAEHGDYLALDLGGTNFRVIYVEMRNGVRTKTIPHHYVIPDKWVSTCAGAILI